MPTTARRIGPRLGFITSGGTESTLLAVKAARERARASGSESARGRGRRR